MRGVHDVEAEAMALRKGLQDEKADVGQATHVSIYIAYNASRAQRLTLQCGTRATSSGKSGLGVTSGRDESMYRNLMWYLERLPANSRVVIWTATVHAARQRGSLSEMPLGARIAERWDDRVATVGFTAYAGYTSRAGRPASPIPDAPPESLEARATSESAWALLDSEKLRAIGRVSSRLLGKFVRNVVGLL